MGEATMTVTMGVHYDMYDREIYASPYETFRRLRDEAPLYFNEQYGFFAVSRHEDVLRVLGDRETFISGKGGVYNVVREGIEMPPGMFIFEDPPQHTMHRGIVSRLFTPRAVNGLELQIRELCTEIVDGLVERDRFDFVKEFALRLPVQVIGMLVGVPKQDQQTLLETFQKNIHEASADPEQQMLEGIMEAAHVGAGQEMAMGPAPPGRCAVRRSSPTSPSSPAPAATPRRRPSAGLAASSATIPTSGASWSTTRH